MNTFSHRLIWAAGAAPVLAVAVASAFPAPALADGMDRPAIAYTMPRTWSGIYVGGQAGYGWGEGTFTHLADSAGVGPFQPVGQGGKINSLQGMFGGGQIGIQHQSGSLVYGVEASYVATNILRRTQNPNFPGLPITDRFSINSVGSLVGRLGYATPSMLAYIKGGLAMGSTDYSGTCSTGAGCAPNNFQVDVGSWHRGYTLGGGVDFRVGGNWTLGVDYSYVHLNSSTDNGSYNVGNIVATYREKADAHLIGVRLNYLFGRDPVPVSLK